MTCPHCGGEMQLEQVFCEHCGKERLLVPVYEPEIEESVAESMNGIIDELGSDSPDNNHTDSNKKTDADIVEHHDAIQDSDHHDFKQLKFLFVSIIVLVIVISVFSICFFFYSDNSYDFHYNKAIAAYNMENWEEALYQTEFCLEENPEELELLLLKLHIYEQIDSYEQKLNVAKLIISIDESNNEANEIVIFDYIKNKNYIDLSKYLEGCLNESIKQKYAEYLASFPEYSEEPGVYESGIALKLFSAGNGDIYYTLDGTTPSKYTDRYTAPIMLNSGEYIVSSVYINEYGVSSDVITKVYEINGGISDIPEVVPESGDYALPEIIYVTVPGDDYTVYYSTNGKDPDLDSNIYTNSFPMPLGTSHYKFMMMNPDGNMSEIVSYDYNCSPSVYFDTEQAIFTLKQNLTARGEVFDYLGATPDETKHKVYKCESAFTKDGAVYYYISEYINTDSGSSMSTGDNYAVSVTDGTAFRVNISSNAAVSLSDL